MADTSQYIQYYKPGQENSTIYTTADILKSAATPGSTNGITYEQMLKNSGYVPQGTQEKQPSLTINSSDLANRPLVSQPTTYRPPEMPVYTPPTTPAYIPPTRTALPEMPKLQQISLGPAPTVQSQDQILQNIQNQIKPLSQEEQQNIKQGVDAGFAPQLAEQKRVNDLRNLFEKAAAAQRGDLGFGTSELTYTGLANVQQAGADALARLQAAKVAEENTRIQAANETNRQNQLELLNQANQLRQQQQQEAQTYINNQMAANDAALQQYKIELDNTRYANEQDRQAAIDQFDALKYQNELQRQSYQDQLQAYTMQQSQAKDALAMISELDPTQMSGLGDLSNIESSLGLPPGYIQALQQTKKTAQNAKNNSEIADVYNQGVQLAMSLPVGQSFSFKNPDGSTTTFTGSKPNEFQVINNSQGVWRVNKDTGEIEQIQKFSSGRSSTSSGSSKTVPAGVSAGIPSNPVFGSGMASGLVSNIATSQGNFLPNNQKTTDISKFDPQIQLIINGQTTFDKLPAKERTKLAAQYNQAYNAGLLPSSQTNQQKPLSGDVAKLKGIVETLPNEARQLQEAFQKDYKTSLQGIITGTDRRLVKLLDQVADKVGRLRSGGAINDAEAARFKSQVASTLDLSFGNSQDAINAIDGIIQEANIVAQNISPKSQNNNSYSDIGSVKNQYGISY